jgi:ATP-dependent Lon protease
MAILLKPKNKLENTQILPLAAIREGVIFPHVEVVLTFGRDKSINAVNQSFASGQEIIFVTQKKPSQADPKQKDLYPIGVLAKIERTLKTNDEINALVRGVSRVSIENVFEKDNYLAVEFTTIPELVESNPEIEALSRHLLNEFKKSVNLGKSVEFLNFMKLMSGVDANELVDQIATTLDVSVGEKQKILETIDLKNRIELVISHLSHEVKVLQIEKNIASKTQKKFDKNMREAVLRERLKTIQNELGEEDEETEEIAAMEKKIEKAGMPDEVKKKALKELKRFATVSVHSPEHSYIRTWLETMIDMPWNKRSKNNVSIDKAQKVLDKDHYALEEVKERITEYLSVLTLKKESKSKLKDRRVPTILCFYGPPGVGKTSIGRSIAKALGRDFAKISLGGIRDEAEIRGHRRTYVGAMPGRIIQNIRQVGSKNPVFMLDEIDKIGADFRGDPSSALLEALDPEQNTEFSDHYLEVPFDLSEIIFITTANVLDTIPPALRDRLEIIQFSGYTLEEKFQIATRHLTSKTMAANGLTSKQIKISPSAMREIIKDYTREAGVRNLEREISKVMRKVAKQIALHEKKSVTVSKTQLQELLGPRKYSSTFLEKTHEPGLATGLAWTQVGGDIILIEVATMPGKGQIVLTGKLGDVMQESAKAAWSYIRSQWKKFGLEENFYKTIDIHVHVPEGAVPKDGPSAGITMATALISALTNTPTKNTVGMTGEITLRGRVMEIGGLKEKSIAGHRAGLQHIIIPKDNQKDLVKIPDLVKKDITFHPVDHIDQVFKIAFDAYPRVKSSSTAQPKKKKAL